MSDKRCPKCGNTYPATPEYFHRRNGDVLQCWCKQCMCAAVGKYDKHRREVQRQRRAFVAGLIQRAQQIVARERRADVALEAITSLWDQVTA